MWSAIHSASIHSSSIHRRAGEAGHSPRVELLPGAGAAPAAADGAAEHRRRAHRCRATWRLEAGGRGRGGGGRGGRRVLLPARVGPPLRPRAGLPGERRYGVAHRHGGGGGLVRAFLDAPPAHRGAVACVQVWPGRGLAPWSPPDADPTGTLQPCGLASPPRSERSEGWKREGSRTDLSRSGRVGGVQGGGVVGPSSSAEIALPLPPHRGAQLHTPAQWRLVRIWIHHSTRRHGGRGGPARGPFREPSVNLPRTFREPSGKPSVNLPRSLPRGGPVRGPTRPA